ncbi:hypothetical protein [Nonomuraea wenchangensis]|uniref:hypothetical protein n=1 Tax=Nonomuraea wenchangensis TaxID=568860 RepID=UPI0033213242
MRTVYVITTKPGGQARAVRRFLALLAARLVYLTAWLGHLAVLAAGAVDALVTAWLGVPRLGYVISRLRRVARQTWEEDL